MAATGEGKGVELARIGEMVGDLFSLHMARVGARAELQGDRTLDVEAIEGGEDAILAGELEQGAVLRAGGDADGGDCLARNTRVRVPPQSTAPERSSCTAVQVTETTSSLRMKRRASMQCTPTSAIGPPVARVASVIQVRALSKAG